MSEKIISKSKSKDKDSKDVKDAKDSKLKEPKIESTKVDKKKEKKKGKEDEKESKKKDSSLDINNDLVDDLAMDMDQDIAHNHMDNKYENYIKRNFNQTNKNNYNRFNSHQNINNVERCDGCFDGEGICFCVNCEKIFCKMCEDQIHVVPINRQHERVPVTDVYHLKKLCYHHNNQLKFYCESCEEPICHECQMVGPHNNKLHRISSVFESFRKKFNNINILVQKSLINKLDIMTNQIQSIEFHIEEIKNVRNGIERDIRAEYSQLIENLRGEEGKKLAILQYESSILQKEVNKIHDIVNTVSDISYNESPDMISFLLKYKQINESIELSLSRPFKKSIDVPIDDFPRDLYEKRAKLEKYEKLKKLLKTKDDIIWNLIQEKKSRDDLEIIKLKEKAHNEISEWAKLSDKYAIELQRYHLVCHFCGVFLDEQNINGLCNKNSSVADKSNKGNFTAVKNIPAEILDSKRHFFGSPNKEFDTQTLKPNTTNDKNVKNPFERNIYNDSNMRSTKKSRSLSPTGNLRYSEEIIKEKNNQDWVWKVASVIQKNNINLFQVLSEYDLDYDGYLNPSDIRLVFSKLQIELSTTEIDDMLNYFNISAMDKISIKDFTKNFISNSNHL